MDPSVPPSETTGPPQDPPLRKLHVVFGVLALLGVAALVFKIAATFPRGSVSGEIRSVGEPHGGFTLFPVDCFSGDHWGFDGVWLVTETLTEGDRTGFRGGLKIVRVEDGRWAAVLENPQRCEVFTCEQTEVRGRNCEVFDLEVERIHRWWRYRGRARLDCTFPEGGTLKADLAFARCGWVRQPGGVGPP